MKTYQTIIILFVIISICISVFILKKEKEKEVVIPSSIATTTDMFINHSNDFYTISAEYPKELKDRDFIMEKDVLRIVNQKKEEWKIGGPLHNEEKIIMSQNPDRPLFLKYELNIQYDQFESKKTDTVSYFFKNYEFTGGAHGGTGLMTYTFDEKGQVHAEDLLDLNGPNSLALSKMLRDKLKVSLGELYNQEMLDGGLGLQFIKNDAMYKSVGENTFNFSLNFKNFVVLDEGIKFIFGQYQVAPYAAGMPEVLLSWEELKTFTKK